MFEDPSPIPFEQFMAQALHDPVHGYYARRIHSVGRGGDFTTAPMLSEAPALAIAKWAARSLREMNLNPAARRRAIDQVAAAVMLQAWLDHRRAVPPDEDM